MYANEKAAKSTVRCLESSIMF